MVTKKTATTKDLKDEVKANASKIWLAGLGALAAAEEEGGKLFRGLVKKGEVYEKKGKEQLGKLRDQVETLADAAKERFGDASDTAKEKAGEAWEKVTDTAGAVEEKWDEKLHGVLRRIGVPSRNEIANLTRRVEQLTEMVGEKAKRAGSSARKSAAKTARSAKKTVKKAAKKATRKTSRTR